jgi:hypothetical protein
LLSGSRKDLSLRNRAAAYAKWANTADPTSATAPARSAFNARFEREVDPQGKLSPEERRRRAEYARKAYYHRLAYLSVKARRKGRGNR